MGDSDVVSLTVPGDLPPVEGPRRLDSFRALRRGCCSREGAPCD